MLHKRTIFFKSVPDLHHRLPIYLWRKVWNYFQEKLPHHIQAYGKLHPVLDEFGLLYMRHGRLGKKWKSVCISKVICCSISLLEFMPLTNTSVYVFFVYTMVTVFTFSFHPSLIKVYLYNVMGNFIDFFPTYLMAPKAAKLYNRIWFWQINVLPQAGIWTGK
jgi:hypothetical protein